MNGTSGFGGTDATVDLDANSDDIEIDTFSYGQPPAAPWRSEAMFDGLNPPMPRRFELLDADERRAWLADVTVFCDWLIATFRLTKWFPPCWRAHTALVEEAQALFLGWNNAWLPGTEPAGPLNWLRELDAALHRIETRWQIACDADQHRSPAPLPGTDNHPVPQSPWWSNPDFDGGRWYDPGYDEPSVGVPR